ncbi:hypothetical protein SOVF_209620, partial [Spinacia oleracea]
EELLQYYLKKKVAFEKIDLDVIRDIDLNKLEPWDIQEKCKIGSGPQNDWYFFSHKDKKYPTGTRTNRATVAGFWKATGRDKTIHSNNKRIGMRKTLVFYKGRAPHGEKSDWIMHEYRLEDCTTTVTIQESCLTEDGWVICRVFKKKNYQKAIESPRSTDENQQSQVLNYSSKKVFDHIFSCMGKFDCPTTDETSTATITNIIPSFNISNSQTGVFDDQYNNHLPMLTCSSSSSPPFDDHNNHALFKCSDVSPPRLSDWMSLDRLIASQLNGCQDDQDLICSNSVMFHG